MSLPVNIGSGKWGPKATVTGDWSAAVEDCIRSQDVKELELNAAKGWRGSDVRFLERLPGLNALTVIDHSIKDVTAIHALRGLKYLDVNTYCKTPVDFGNHPQLDECALEWRPGSESLFAHRGVRKVFVNKCPLKDLRAMAMMTSLESLSLASPKLETLQGVEALTALTFLGLYVARRLTSVDGVQAVPNLVHLEVNDCPKIRDIAPIAALYRLRNLQLCNDGDIETIKPLGALKELEQFLFYESTNVLDGDLSPLKSLPKLRHVTFMDRMHYTLRRSEFPNGGETSQAVT
jgi:Leucine-rich repeat (LRR) protein